MECFYARVMGEDLANDTRNYSLLAGLKFNDEDLRGLMFITMMKKNWLVRTFDKKLYAHFKRKINQPNTRWKINGDDEICPGNHFWVYVMSVFYVLSC